MIIDEFPHPAQSSQRFRLKAFKPEPPEVLDMMFCLEALNAGREEGWDECGVVHGNGVVLVYYRRRKFIHLPGGG